MAAVSKAAQRAIANATAHAANENTESAARVLGAAWRSALRASDQAAIADAAREIGCGLYACPGAQAVAR